MMRRRLMFKLITCIAPEDKAQETVQQIDATYGIQSSISHFARGLGRSSTSSTTTGLGQQTEKTTFSVLVPTHQVDEIFDFIYHTADLHRPHGGIIYVTSVKHPIISPNINAQKLGHMNTSEPDSEATLVN